MDACFCYRFFWRYLGVVVIFMGCAGPTEEARTVDHGLSEQSSEDASDSSSAEGDIFPDTQTGCAEKTPCDDGDSCTVGDQCDADGECVGVPYSCDDGQECTLGSCDGEGGCGFEILDGHCYIGGACVLDGAQMPDNDCLGCAVALSQVGWSNLDGRACDDGDLCTVDDRCTEGTCMSELGLVCADGNPCTDDSCDSESGCLFTQNLSPCDDGKPDTRDDTCTEEGLCVGIQFTCEEPGPCVESVIPNGKDCSYTYMLAGTLCDDLLLNTRNDFCDGFGSCKGSEYSCDASAQCVKSSEENGVDCTLVLESEGTSCDDMMPNTKGDSCDASGACQGVEFFCEPSSSCVASSKPNGEVCIDTYFSETTKCDDGILSTKDDVCDGLGGCVGVSFSCDASDQCVASSVPNGMDCTLEWETENVPCDDGASSTRNDFCDGKGGCKGESYSCESTNPCVLTALPNGKDCSVVYKPEGSECDDGSLETSEDECTAQGNCLGVPLLCDASPECVLSSQPDGTQCVVVYAEQGSSCEDGNPDTLNDVCNGFGVCSGSPACAFDSSNPDSPCQAAECTVDLSSDACLALIAVYCANHPDDVACVEDGGEAGSEACEFFFDRPGSPCYEGVWVDVCVEQVAPCELFIAEYCVDNGDDPGCDGESAGEAGECLFDVSTPGSPCFGGDWVDVCVSGGSECTQFISDYCVANPEDTGCDSTEDGEGESCVYDSSSSGTPCDYAPCQSDWNSIECAEFIEAYCQSSSDSSCPSGL